MQFFNLFYIHNLLPYLLNKRIVIHSAVYTDMTEIYTIQFWQVYWLVETFSDLTKFTDCTK